MALCIPLPSRTRHLQLGFGFLTGVSSPAATRHAGGSPIPAPPGLTMSGASGQKPPEKNDVRAYGEESDSALCVPCLIRAVHGLIRINIKLRSIIIIIYLTLFSSIKYSNTYSKIYIFII